MDYLDLYNFWKTDEFFDIATRNELAALNLEADEKRNRGSFLSRP
ncbi:MAG: hypothetical protein ACLSA0_05525 [Eisenbergiella massiliensis]